MEGHHQRNQPRDKQTSRQGPTAISCSKPSDFAAILLTNSSSVSDTVSLGTVVFVCFDKSPLTALHPIPSHRIASPTAHCPPPRANLYQLRCSLASALRDFAHSAPRAPIAIIPRDRQTQWHPRGAQYNTPSQQGKTLISSPRNKNNVSSKPYVYSTQFYPSPLPAKNKKKARLPNFPRLSSSSSSTPTKTGCSRTRSSGSYSGRWGSSCPRRRRTSCCCGTGRSRRAGRTTRSARPCTASSARPRRRPSRAR